MARHGQHRMISSALLAVLLAAAAPARAEDAAAIELAVADITIRQRLIVRVPIPRPPAPAPPTRWHERRGARCIDLSRVGGAAISAPDSVDIILRGGVRIRAELESECPALDFYSGFYLVPTADGRICADRDSIHARSGGECQIERFRKLVPARGRQREP